MIDAQLDKLVLSHQKSVQLVCNKLIDEMIGLGFDADDFNQKPDYETAIFELVKDPYTGDRNLLANWVDKHHHLIGQLQFLSNGSIYAEYDVIKQHPEKPNMFIEAVTVWGKTDYLKSDIRLLPFS